MTAFEKAASEQGAAHAADGTSTEAPATVDADGVPRLPLDDAIKLLVRAVQEVISLYLPHVSLYLPSISARCAPCRRWRPRRTSSSASPSRPRWLGLGSVRVRVRVG